MCKFLLVFVSVRVWHVSACKHAYVCKNSVQACKQAYIWKKFPKYDSVYLVVNICTGFWRVFTENNVSNTDLNLFYYCSTNLTAF